MNQQFHRYIPHQLFLRRVDNGISDIPSRYRETTNTNLLSYIKKNYPQSLT